MIRAYITCKERNRLVSAGNLTGEASSPAGILWQEDDDALDLDLIRDGNDKKEKKR